MRLKHLHGWMTNVVVMLGGDRFDTCGNGEESSGLPTGQLPQTPSGSSCWGCPGNTQRITESARTTGRQ